MTDKETKIKNALIDKKNYSESYAFCDYDMHRIFDIKHYVKVCFGVDEDIQFICLKVKGIHAYGDPIRINPDGTYNVVFIKHCSCYEKIKINNKLRHVIVCNKFDTLPTDITYAYTMDELQEICKVCNAFEINYPYMI